MAETEQRNGTAEGTSSDDDFETVVRKRHSNANSQKFRNGGMDYGGRGRDRERTDFRNTRPYRRTFRDGRDSRERDFKSENRRPGERDRDKQKSNAIPTLKQPLKMTQQQQHHPERIHTPDLPQASNNNNNISNSKGQEEGAAVVVVVVGPQPEIVIAPAPLPVVNPWRVNKNSIVSTTSVVDPVVLPKKASPTASNPTSKPTTPKHHHTKPNLKSFHRDLPAATPAKVQEEEEEEEVVVVVVKPVVVVQVLCQKEEEKEMVVEPAEEPVEKIITPEPPPLPELVIAPAPLPAVNPWHVNKNAVSVITKKILSESPLKSPQTSTPSPTPVVVAEEQSKAVPQQQVGKKATTNNKTSSSSVPNSNKAAKTRTRHKTLHKTNNNNANPSQTTLVTQLFNGTSQSATVEQSKGLKNGSRRSDNANETLSQAERKNIQPGPKLRRGFAAVTKHQKGIHSNQNQSLSSTQNSPEDWPSLQTTVVVTVAQAQTKPVIPMTHEMKLNRANRGDTTRHRTNGPKVEGYQDYPADYTTLPPLYPMTEFVMPYTNEAFYSTNFSTPQGTVVDDAQLVAGYVPVEDTVLLEFVRKQIEYYLSEENLKRDFYLRKKMDSDGFLPVHIIGTFPRVKVMTQNLEIVTQAIEASQNMELTEDGLYVRPSKEPKKWPLPADSLLGITTPPLKSTSNVIPFPSTAAYQTNGYVSLSSEDSNFHYPSSIAEKLNPNVPEFIPRSLTA